MRLRKSQNSSAFNVCLGISVILHVLLIIFLPVSQFAGGGWSIYALESFGINDGNPFEASIAYTASSQTKQSTSTTPTTTASLQEAKKTNETKVATTPQTTPEPPKVSTTTTQQTKQEPPKTTTPTQTETKQEPPKVSTPATSETKTEPAKQGDNTQKTSNVDVVTTTNPDADVSVPVEETKDTVIEQKEPEPPVESEPQDEPEPEPEPEEPQDTDKSNAQIIGETSPGGSETGEGEEQVPPPPKFVTVQGSSLYLGGIGIVYPKDARAESAKGTVTLAVTINITGVVEKVEIIKSSGFTSLDNQALDRVRHGSFQGRGETYVLEVYVEFSGMDPVAKITFGDVVFRED